MTTRTDSELLRDYTENGSEIAFSELVRRYIDLVYSSALRLVVDQHLAEDITQATFLALAREARNLTGRALLSGWLHRTAVNLAAKLVRGEMRRRSREQEAYKMQSPQPEIDPAWKQVAPGLDAALEQLGEGDRTVILLRYFERKTALEIGATLKLSEEAAQKRVTRAVERLRGLLTGQGASLSATALAALITTQAVMAAPAGLALSVSTAALAGASAATGFTLGSIKLLLMTKLKIGAVSALVIAGIGGPFIFHHHYIQHLRAENRSLRDQARQTDQLSSERESLVVQLEGARQGQSLTKAQLSELMRLRGEIAPLRRDSQELARLRRQLAEPSARPTPRAAAAHPDFLPAAAWANVGADKPASAIQTLFWAGKHGETNLVGDLLRWRRDPDIPESDDLDETFARGIIAGATRFAGSLQGFRVTSQEGQGNEVRLGIELTDAQGQAKPHTLRLVQEDNQWFPVMHVWMEGEGSIRAAMEVPKKMSGESGE